MRSILEKIKSRRGLSLIEVLLVAVVPILLVAVIAYFFVTISVATDPQGIPWPYDDDIYIDDEPHQFPDYDIIREPRSDFDYALNVHDLIGFLGGHAQNLIWFEHGGQIPGDPWAPIDMMPELLLLPIFGGHTTTLDDEPPGAVYTAIANGSEFVITATWIASSEESAVDLLEMLETAWTPCIPPVVTRMGAQLTWTITIDNANHDYVAVIERTLSLLQVQAQNLIRAYRGQIPHLFGDEAMAALLIGFPGSPATLDNNPTGAIYAAEANGMEFRIEATWEAPSYDVAQRIAAARWEEQLRTFDGNYQHPHYGTVVTSMGNVLIWEATIGFDPSFVYVYIAEVEENLLALRVQAFNFIGAYSDQISDWSMIGGMVMPYLMEAFPDLCIVLDGNPPGSVYWAFVDSTELVITAWLETTSEDQAQRIVQTHVPIVPETVLIADGSCLVWTSTIRLR